MKVSMNFFLMACACVVLFSNMNAAYDIKKISNSFKNKSLVKKLGLTSVGILLTARLYNLYQKKKLKQRFLSQLLLSNVSNEKIGSYDSIIKNREYTRRIKLYKIQKKEYEALKAVNIFEENPEELIGNPYWLIYIDAQRHLNKITQKQADMAYNFFKKTTSLITIDFGLMYNFLKTEKDKKEFEVEAVLLKKKFPLYEGRPPYKSLPLIIQKNLRRRLFLHEISHALIGYEMLHEPGYIYAKDFNAFTFTPYKLRKEKEESLIFDASKLMRFIKIALAGIIGECIFANQFFTDLRQFYSLYGAIDGDFFDVRKSALEYVIYASIQKNRKEDLDVFMSNLDAKNLAQEALDLINQQCKEVYEKMLTITTYPSVQKKIERLCNELEKNLYSSSSLFFSSSKETKIQEAFVDLVLKESNEALALPSFAREKIEKIVEEIKDKEKLQGIYGESEYKTISLKGETPDQTWKNIVSSLKSIEAIKKIQEKKYIKESKLQKTKKLKRSLSI